MVFRVTRSKSSIWHYNDTIANSILMRRLERWVGLFRSALDWFFSYLKGCNFSVCLKFSYKYLISIGVPQGSILGPFSFNLSLLTLCFLLRNKVYASIFMSVTSNYRYFLPPDNLSPIDTHCQYILRILIIGFLLNFYS